MFFQSHCLWSYHPRYVKALISKNADAKSEKFSLRMAVKHVAGVLARRERVWTKFDVLVECSEMTAKNSKKPCFIILQLCPQQAHVIVVLLA